MVKYFMNYTEIAKVFLKIVENNEILKAIPYSQNQENFEPWKVGARQFLH